MSFVLNIPLNAHPDILKALADFVGKVAEHNQNLNFLESPPITQDAVYDTTQEEIRANHVSINDDQSLPEIPTHGYTTTLEEMVPHSQSPPPSPKTTEELDSTGLPWDPRIHSRTKSKRPTGEWKLQRGINPATVQQVILELRGNSANVPPPPPVSINPPIATGRIAPPPPPPAASDPFADFVCRVMQFIPTGKLSRQTLTEVLNRFGFADLPAVKHAPELIPMLEKAIMEIVQ